MDTGERSFRNRAVRGRRPFIGPDSTVRWTAVESGPDGRFFDAPLSLRKKTQMDGTERVAEKRGKGVRERIRQLEAQRVRIDRELAHLKNLEETAFLCLFEEKAVETVARFAAEYPVHRLSRFLYFRCRSAHDASVYHLLIGKEGTHLSDLPADIRREGTVYIREAEWRAAGVEVYLPESYAIRPFIGFENALQLLRTFQPHDATPGTDVRFMLRPVSQGADVEKFVFSLGDAVEFTDAIRNVNTGMCTVELACLPAASIQTQTAAFQEAHTRLSERLEEARRSMETKLFSYLEKLDADLENALDELDDRRRELDEYATARRTMAEYCRAIREIVRHPGNDLMAFLRKETDLNRTLAGRLGSIDYRYIIQFETYEQQVNQITGQHMGTSDAKFENLLAQVEAQGRALQEQTDTLRTELERFHETPDRLRQFLTDITNLHGAIRQYTSAIRKTTTRGERKR